MGFWLLFFISLAFQVVGELLRPKQKQEGIKPSGLSDFTFPTADATRIIPRFWGTCKLQGPNTVWFGDLKTKIIKKKVKTGLFSSTKVEQGVKYYLGVQLIFGYGKIDELFDVLFDDKSIFEDDAKTGTQGGYGPSGAFASLTPGNSLTVGGTTVYEEDDYYHFDIDKPELLGDGDPKEGVSGPVKLYKGTFTQPANAYLQGQWAEVETSGFRPLCYMVLEQCYLGNSNRPPPVSIVARCTPNPLGLTGGKHNIAGDANAANMCYEIMTDLIWGMKIPAGKVDIDSFIECGNTIADEGLGVSMIVETAIKGRALLAEILRHVDGVIYPDPETGLYTMRLARGDYDVDDLPVLDKTNVDVNSIEFSRVSWEDTKSTTIISYTDRNANFDVLPVRYNNPANVYARRGQIDSEQIDFLGYSNVENAKAAAARTNKTVSAPLCRLSFNVNRGGYQLRPASVVRFNFPEFRLSNLILRVIDINYGSLDNMRIQCSCTEDIFSVSSFAFDAPPDTGWEPPSAIDPTALAYSDLWELPYQLIQTEARLVAALGARNDATSVLGFEVWSDDLGGSNYVLRDRSVGVLCAGTLDGAYSIDDATLTIDNVQDPDLLEDATDEEVAQGLSLLVIDDEIMAWKTHVVNMDGSVTFSDLIPAVADTVPADHVDGATVYILNSSIPLTSPAGYSEDLTITAKLPTFTSTQTLALSGTPQKTITTVSRAQRPNPPGKFQVNGDYPWEISAAAGTLAITFADRNKLTDTVVAQSAASTSLEPGVTYLLRAYDDDDDTLLIEQDQIGGSPINFEWDTSLNLRLELYSVNANGQESLWPQQAVLAYTTSGSTVITFPEPDPTTQEQLDQKATKQEVQQGSLLFTIAGGTADAMTATITPTFPLVDGMQIHLRAIGANTVTNPTLALNGGTARTITKFGGSALAAGDISGAGHEIILRYRASATRWELVTPAASGTGGGGTGDVVGPSSSVDNHLVFFDGATGKLLKDSGLTISGTNTGDQTSIVGITGTLAEFNAALTGATFLTFEDSVLMYQPLHANLDYFSGLSLMANSLIILDGGSGDVVAFGANTFPARNSTSDLIPYTISDDAITLVGSADYAGMRALLSVPTIAYVDAAVTGLLDFKGNTNASGNPNYPAALKGDAYYISVAGRIGGVSGKQVDVGDVYVANSDNAGGTEASVGSSWFVMEHNLVGAMVGSNNLSELTNTSTALSNLGGTAIGKLIFQVATPGVASYVRLNADGSISVLSASAMLTALGGATDSAVMHLAGTEDVTGAKTFSHANGLKSTGGPVVTDRTGDSAAAQNQVRADSGFTATWVGYLDGNARMQWGLNSSGNTFLTVITAAGASTQVAIIDNASGVWDWKVEPTLNGAKLATMTITDSGGYFSTDTVEGALQELGAVLAFKNNFYGGTTSTGNVGAGEDTLQTYTLPANTLITNGQRITFRASGSVANNANAKRVRIKFGATTIYDTGALPTSAAFDWVADGEITRRGATSQVASVVFTTSNSTIPAKVDSTLPAETLSGTVTLLVTGEAVSNNDILCEALSVTGTGATAAGGRIYKAAAETRNTTTTTTDDGALVVSLGVGVYNVTCKAKCEAANGTMGFKWGQAFSGTATVLHNHRRATNATGGATNTDNEVTSSTAALIVNSSITAGSAGLATVEFDTLLNVIVAGNFSFQWAQVVSNGSNATVHPGSWIEANKIS